MNDDPLLHLLDLAADEVALLREALVGREILDDQWSRSPGRPRSAADAGQPRAPKSGVKRPTEDAALDPLRLELRRVLVRAAPVVRDAIVALRATRRAVEIAHERWEGD